MIKVNTMQAVQPSSLSKEDGTQKQVPNQTTIPADPYANVKRELSEEELTSPAVQKLLLNDNYRMEKEMERLKEYESLYHAKDKEAAVLSEKISKSTGSEILFTACETVGSLLAGISANYWSNKGWILLIIGSGLVLGGIIYKFVVK